MKKPFLVAAVLGFATAAFSQNLVLNPGFETGDLTNWTVAHAGSFSGVWTNFPHSGTYNAYFGAVSSTDAEDFYQDIATTIGTTYTVSFWAFDEDATDTNENLDVMFAGNTVFNGIPQRGSTSSSNYAQYSGNFVATSTTSRLEVSGWEQLDYINADDFSVTAVPEPASMAALGIGVVALIRRRRRAK
ncbi:MAG TPA: carbohydrate binding domain-containing protein [Fimbriimonadaceae bacterium]|nr:carbohydrate binding domain-containing protein [Fimbriimonadaceae bacterium]